MKETKIVLEKDDFIFKGIEDGGFVVEYFDDQTMQIDPLILTREVNRLLLKHQTRIQDALNEIIAPHGFNLEEATLLTRAFNKVFKNNNST